MQTPTQPPLGSNALAGDFGLLGLGTHDSACVDFGTFGPDTHDSTGAGLAARHCHPSDRAGRGERDYSPRLPTAELIAEVRWLLATGRRTERLLCRYLADLADRVQARGDADLGPYIDELELARSCFGLGARETRERVRIGRALRHLPNIEAALIGGRLSYSRVREVTRVVTAQTEHEWLEFARRADMRELERKVAASRAAMGTKANAQRNGRMASDNWIGIGMEAASPPACSSRRHSSTRRVMFELSSEAWELVESAMQAARRATTVELSDGEALEAVARVALSVQSMARATGWGDCEMGDGRAAMVRKEAWNPDAREPGTATSVNDLYRLELPAAPFSVGNRGASLLELHASAAQAGSRVALEQQANQRGSAVALDQQANQAGSRVALEQQANQRGSAVALDQQANQAGSMTYVDMLETQAGSMAGVDEPETQAGSMAGVHTLETQAGSTVALDQQATQRGSAVAPEQQATQAGSRHGVEPVCNTPPLQCDPGTRLLAVMGRRHRWTLDALTEASGLLAREVSVATLLLELQGRIRRYDSAYECV